MAHYTTTMWWMRDELGYEISELFPSDFDYYDPKNRERFMTLFYDHYFDREIGFETYSLFIHKLKAKLNIIMPKYTHMFESFRLINDPFNEYEEIEKYTKDIDGDYSSSSESTDKTNSISETSTNTENNNKSRGSSENITSDTPQGYLKTSDLYDHATNVSFVKDSNDSDGTSKSSGKGTGSADTLSKNKSVNDKKEKEIKDRTIQGRKTNQMELIAKYQDMYRNLDEMIIHECRDLFMGVF